MTLHRLFFFFLLVFLPTQLGYHFWPEWAMVLGRRVDYLAPTIYLTDILVFLTLTFWLLGEISKIKNQRSKIQITYQKLLPPSATLLIVFLNVAAAANPYVAMYKWLKVAEFISLGWYIVRTKPSLLFIVTPLSVGVLYSSVLAIAQFILQHSVGGPLWLLGERTFTVATPGIARVDWFGRELLRPYATFPHPNVLGGFLAAVLPLVFMSLMSPMGQMKKRMYVASLVAGVVALFLTFSRSAMVIGAVAIAFAVARIKKPFILYSSFFALLFAIVATTDIREESVVVRGQLNAAAMKLWQTSPFFGVGLGNFLVRLPEVLPTRTVYFLQPVHNIYLLLVSEVGIVGFLVFLWFLRRSFQNFKFQISNFKLSFLAFLLLGLLDHYPLTLQQGQLLFTILAAESLAWVH